MRFDRGFSYTFTYVRLSSSKRGIFEYGLSEVNILEMKIFDTFSLHQQYFRFPTKTFHKTPKCLLSCSKNAFRWLNE